MRFLSPEWIAALDAAGRRAGVPDDVSLVIQQVVDLDGGRDAAYHVVLNGGTARVRPGRAPSADVTMTQPYALAAAISRGELNAQAAIVTGGLRLSGDLELLVRHGRTLAGLEDLFAEVRGVTEY